MLAQVLYKAFGRRVGLFTSPHLVRINERIKINDTEIEDSDLTRLVEMVLRDQPQDDPFTFFELITLVAVHYFLEQNVEYAVFEVGVWGTHDTTNIWEKPLATFITSVHMDHKQLLWPTLAQIQRNKMGIMKKWVPCYTPIDNPLMHWGAKIKQAKLHIVYDCVPTSLHWAHQQKNAAVVLHALREQWFPEKPILQGLQQVVHLGRLQFLTPHILLDGAHNAEGILALREYVASIRKKYSPLVTIFATTKSTENLLEFTDLLIQGDENFVVSTSTFNKKLPTRFPFVVQEFTDIEAVVNYLRTVKRGLVVVYGSLYLLWEVLKQRE